VQGPQAHVKQGHLISLDKFIANLQALLAGNKWVPFVTKLAH
jgi:hypothetical protein